MAEPVKPSGPEWTWASENEGEPRAPLLGTAEMDRRRFLQRLSMGSLSVLGTSNLGGLAGCSDETTGPDRPNIVLLLADDMGYSDIGCFGGEMRTPNLDGLAGNGLRFTHFHNGARCCPSRASLLTGLYPHQAGVGDMMNDRGLPGYRGDLSDNCVTLAEVLREAGYGTFACGKWHVSRFFGEEGPKENWPCQRGFDRFFGTINGAGSFFEPRTLTLDNDPAGGLPEGFYYPEAVADHAVGFLGDHSTSDVHKPFFLFGSFTTPHWPLHAPAEDVARAQGRFDSGWDRLRGERYQRMMDMGIVDSRWALTERDGRVDAWVDVQNREWQLRRMEVYAAQVEVMDRSIGRILEELRRQGAMENTLILFLSDNGGCAEELNTQGWFDYILRGREMVGRETTLDGKPMQVGNDPRVMPGPYDTYQSYGIPWANVSNTPFRLYKSFVHEGGVATPLLIHWPAGIRARGELRRNHGFLADIMATLVEVSGASYPEVHGGRRITPMEGHSLVPTFSGGVLDRDAIFFEHEGSRAVLTPERKLVARGRRGGWEFYDMVSDRTETVDLAERYPAEVQRLAAMWEAWAERAQVIPWENGV